MYLNFFTAAACIFAVTHLHCLVTKNFLPENRFRAFIAILCFCDISELTLCLKQLQTCFSTDWLRGKGPEDLFKKKKIKNEVTIVLVVCKNVSHSPQIHTHLTTPLFRFFNFRNLKVFNQSRISEIKDQPRFLQSTVYFQMCEIYCEDVFFKTFIKREKRRNQLI